jgi:hypothetical protein
MLTVICKVQKIVLWKDKHYYAKEQCHFIYASNCVPFQNTVVDTSQNISQFMRVDTYILALNFLRFVVFSVPGDQHEYSQLSVFL